MANHDRVLYNGDSMSIVFISIIGLKMYSFSYEWTQYNLVYMMPSDNVVQHNIGDARHYSDIFATTIDHTPSFEMCL